MIEIQERGEVRELRLARPPVNALNLDVVSALREALAGAASDSKAGIILSGSPGIFSAGLDLKDLLALSREDLERFWRAFFALLQDLARSPCPVVAALTGHSPAGGAVLALFCDRRIAAEGNKFAIGLNEVQVGLVVPWPIQLAFVRLVGQRQAEKLLVSGALMSPDEALAAGFVDEVVPAALVVDRAAEYLEGLAALPGTAMRETRQLLRAQYSAPFDEVRDEDFEKMLDGWFSDETQANLRAVLERLAGRKR